MKTRLLALLAVVVVLIGAMSFVGSAAGAETLTGNVDSKIITEDTELNLAGFSIGTLTVESGVTVTVSNVGNIGEVKGGGIVELADGEMNLAGNKLTLKTAGISLRADNLTKNGASVYYTSTFGGNEAVKEQIVAYGTAMYVGSSKNLFADNTFTRNEDLSGWNAGVEKFNDNGVLLKGILKTDNAYSINKANATKQIYNVPYVELADGTRITGATVNRNLKQVVETATDDTTPGNDFWDSMNYAQKKNVVNLYSTFSTFMTSWDLGRLEPYMEDITYPLYTASDIQLMADKPAKDYALMANIDMKGATINGITNFTGSITGNGYAISNGTINGIGFVDTVAAGESITNLHLRDVNVVVPATSKATAVGTIAGTNNGTITGSSATGSVKDTRANVAMGALVGNNAGTLTPSTAVTDNVVVNTLKTDGSGIGSNNTTYTTSNLAASVGLYNDAAGVTKGLIGTGTAVANADNVYWRDRSYSTERQDQVLQDRRQTAVDYVYQSATIKWTVPSTMTYYNDQANYSAIEKPSGFWGGLISGSFHIHTQRFNPGTTYIGIPYTHCSSSLEQTLFYMTDNGDGTYTVKTDIASIKGGNKKSGNFITGYTYTKNTGDADWTSSATTSHAQYDASKLGWARYIGSDCSSALTMGWHTVSPILTSAKNNGGVCLYYTTNIVPSQYNQWFYGVRQVGDYEVNDATMSNGEIKTTSTANKVTMSDYGLNTDQLVTDIIENQGGIQTVYEAYAQTQMGDILNASGTAGHSRMAAIDPVVIRNAKGVIDPAKSYFVTHEQGDGLYERADTNSSWRINYKYTFEQLAYQNTEGLTGSSGYYLPVSMDAFHDVNVAKDGVTLSGGRAIGDTNDPSYVVINSSYRIQNATMVIKDADGNVLYNKTAYQGASSSQARRRATPGNIIMWMNEFFGDYGTNLTAGETYYFTITGTTFTGYTNNVYTNQAFVYTPAS